MILGAKLVIDLPAISIFAWGRKPSSLSQEKLSKKLKLPLLRIEDGFLRSFGPGSYYPALSTVIDTRGIYYDSTVPSDLEVMLLSDDNLIVNEFEVEKAINIIINEQLSKYNHAPAIFDLSKISFKPFVLVLDQTFGDMSVLYGGATDKTFAQMLDAAIEENPGLDIWVKTHPEVIAGSKAGYLSHLKSKQLSGGSSLRIITENINPIYMLKHAHKVYTVSSGMGFEALLCNKPVRCFGMPWYASWGLTNDELICYRRKKTRSVKELFSAAYLKYSKYLNPVTYQQGTVFDVMNWLILQRKMAGLA